MKNVTELERSVKALVARVGGTAEASVFSVPAFRKTTSETLSEMRKDFRGQGGTGEEPFWNLVMYDKDPGRKALFLVTVFTPDALTVYANEGIPEEVVHICSRFAMKEVDAMEAAFEDAYRLRDNAVRVPRVLAELWLSQL